MTVLMIRSRFKDEYVADAQAAIEKVIQALEQAQPASVRYASGRLGDGDTFFALLEVENLEHNPLFELPEYAELLQNLKQWQPEPATVERLTVTGSYRLF